MGFGYPRQQAKTIRAALAFVPGGQRRTWAIDEQTQPFPRVRGASPVVSDPIERASERSSTFLQLVTTIKGTDGIVYVHLGQCGRQVLSCLLLAITQAGPNRMLHIKVDPRRKGNHLIVSIAHELTHAIEVLSEPTVVDGNSAHNFFQRMAPIDRDRYSFETQAAIETALMVDKELRAWERRQRGRDTRRSDRPTP
jgi:hypothetical protein